MIVVWSFFAVPWVCLHFVIVVFPAHSHLLFEHIMLDTGCLIMIFGFKSSYMCSENTSFETFNKQIYPKLV